MRNELAVQTKCVNTINDMGGHAFKSNNRFKAGILDVHLTIAEGSCFLEWKYSRQIKNTYRVRATPKQQQFANKEFSAGGKVAGLLFLQHAKERNTWAIVRFDVKSKNYSEGTFEWSHGPIKWSAVLTHVLLRDLAPEIEL